MVSIIIPTYNEEANIEKLQAQLDSLNGNFEVIFSDGFSKDRTYDLIRYPKLQKATGRARQMNEGAKLASGDYLWFLHADSLIGDQSITLIENSNLEAGCFRIKFHKFHWLLSIIAFNSNNRVRLRNIAFGDQGIFIKRELFFRIGMYRDIPIMEDYDLSMRLRESGMPICQLPLHIVTSGRRFLKNGVFKTMCHMQVLQWKFRHGKDISKIYKSYSKTD